MTITIPTCEQCGKTMIQALRRPICGPCLKAETATVAHFWRLGFFQQRIRQAQQTMKSQPIQSS